MKIINDPQTKRQMEASKKILGDEGINYNYLDISTSPLEPGRGDLLSYFIYNNYQNWKFLVNLNQVRDPFELLEIAYKSNNIFTPKILKFSYYSTKGNLMLSSQEGHIFDKKALF